MSEDTYASRTREHALTDLLRSLRDQCTEPKWADDVDPDFGTVEFLQRVQSVATAIEARIKSGDPFLIPLTKFEAIRTELAAVEPAIGQALADPSSVRPDDYYVRLDNAIALAAALPVSHAAQADALVDGANSFASKIAEQYDRQLERARSLSADLDEVRERLTEYQNEFGNQKTRLDNLINGAQETFRNQQNEISQAAENQRNAIRKEFDEQKGAFTQHIENSRSEFDTGLATFSEETEARVGQILESMKARLDDAERIAGVITDTGMVGGYQRTANEEKKSKERRTATAIWSMVGLIFTAATMLVFPPEPTYFWGGFATRVFIASAFGILAAYSAKLASDHAHTERTFRQLELELATIGPFMDSLGPEQQEKLRIELVNRYFGHPESSQSSAEVQKTTGTVRDLLNLSVSALIEIAKGKR